jgi:hypothetical protein
VSSLLACSVDCHNSAKRIEEGRGYSTEIGIDGMPIDRRHPGRAVEVPVWSESRNGREATLLFVCLFTEFGTRFSTEICLANNNHDVK